MSGEQRARLTRAQFHSKTHSIANGMAQKWVRNEHPEVFAGMRAAAEERVIAEFGEPEPKKPRRLAWTVLMEENERLRAKLAAAGLIDDEGDG